MDLYNPGTRPNKKIPFAFQDERDSVVPPDFANAAPEKDQVPLLHGHSTCLKHDNGVEPPGHFLPGTDVVLTNLHPVVSH